MFRFNTQKIKYFISGAIVSSLLTSTIAFADLSQIKLTINGNQIQSDVSPQMINGRVFVPVRLVSENLGASVKYDADNKNVIIESRNNVNNNVNNDTSKTVNNIGSGSGAYSPVNNEKQGIQMTQPQPQPNSDVITQTQTKVYQDNSKYEVLKDYPIPEGSSGKPIRYNGSIYFPLRLGAEIYGINFPNIKIDDQNNAVIFPNNASIELNSTNSITYQYRLYLREDIFSNNNNNE